MSHLPESHPNWAGPGPRGVLTSTHATATCSVDGHSTLCPSEPSPQGPIPTLSPGKALPPEGLNSPQECEAPSKMTQTITLAE